jgi:hypothetical protein
LCKIPEQKQGHSSIPSSTVLNQDAEEGWTDIGSSLVHLEREVPGDEEKEMAAKAEAGVICCVRRKTGHAAQLLVFWY